MRHVRLRTLLPVAAVAVGLTLAGCSSSQDDSTDVPTAQVAATADCLAPQVLDALDLTPAPGTAASVPPSTVPHVDAPAPGRVPEEFVATGALLCTPGGPLVDSAGTWSSVLARRVDGDTTALVAALRSGSTRSGSTRSDSTRSDSARSDSARSDAAISDDAACGTSAMMDLWLVDALGGAVRVAVPAGACDAVDAALDSLALTDSTSYAVALLAPSPTAGP